MSVVWLGGILKLPRRGGLSFSRADSEARVAECERIVSSRIALHRAQPVHREALFGEWRAWQPYKMPRNAH